MPRLPKHLICEYCGETFATHHIKQECCSQSCSAKLKAQRYRETNEKNKVTAWACGCGVESTAIAALIVLGAIPKPDYSYFVNSGFEKRRTLEHLHSHLIPELKKAGVELHVIEPDSNRLIVNGRVIIPLFCKTNDGKDCKLPSRCGQWKVPHSKRWLRGQGVTRCDCLIGISTDESKRQRESFSWWYQHRYPLIEMGISRRDCEDIIARIGWPDAPRTSCYLCPNQHNADWQEMKDNYPDDFQKAIEAEAEVQHINSGFYLHQRCVPLNDVDFTRQGQGSSSDIDRWFNDSKP